MCFAQLNLLSITSPRTSENLLNTTAVVAQGKAFVHYVVGDKEGGDQALDQSCRVIKGVTTGVVEGTAGVIKEVVTLPVNVAVNVVSAMRIATYRRASLQRLQAALRLPVRWSLGHWISQTWRQQEECLALSKIPSPTVAAVSPQPNQLDRIQEQLNKIFFDLAPLASLVADVRSIKTELSGLKEALDMAHELISNFSNKMCVCMRSDMFIKSFTGIK
ncbi:Uncharacterized protein OBRU01_23509, partial [Operophtera brumata]